MQFYACRTLHGVNLHLLPPASMHKKKRSGRSYSLAIADRIGNCLLQCMILLWALCGHPTVNRQCPLSRLNQPSAARTSMSANDPKGYSIACGEEADRNRMYCFRAT